MSVEESAVHKVYWAYCRFLACTIGFVLPPRLWYRTMYRVCFLHGLVFRVLLGFSPLRNDFRRRVIVTWLMQSTLPHLVARNKPFPIPTSHKNLDIFLDARKNSNGVVLCSVHLPFIRIGFQCLALVGELPTAVIAGSEAMVNGQLLIDGTKETIPAIAANSREVLVKVRQILRKGGCVAALVDAYPGDSMNCNLFRLISCVGARLVFATTELQPDGVIAVEFFLPPNPLCQDDEAVRSNLRFLQSRKGQILQVCLEPELSATYKGRVHRSPVVDVELTPSAEKLRS
jgi:hypothetical protein